MTDAPAVTPSDPATEWHTTACILCSINCGVEVRTEGRHITRVRGDKSHPGSQGYTCEKALRLDHYQSARDRLTSPMRRRDDGTYEAVDWDTAIAEVASRLAAVRDEHGGASIFYYGGGGQGNHLGGGYGRSLRTAVGNVYSSNALAQEKTGEFWVDGQLFGANRCHTTGDYEHAEVAVFLGKNPWQSHGFPRARVVLKEIARDPERALVVIDPRRTETAELADFHLQVRPGTDAWCLGALLKVVVEEQLADTTFLAEHTVGYEELAAVLAIVDVDRWSRTAGLDPGRVRTVARRIAGARGVSIYEDLGLQQAPHSTLDSYLEKLLFLLTGNFGVQGGMNLHTAFVPLFGGGGAAEGGVERRSPVGGHRIISGMIPAAAIPGEILTDHPDRFRAMIVESGNPVHSLPDSQRMREAMAALDFVLVIDVAMTETARCADYVLPAASQFEKWECTFFTLEFPRNFFHLRRPLFEPLPGTLPEPEIHARLVRALGGYTDDDLAPLHAAAAEGRSAYASAFFAAMGENPAIGRNPGLVLYETLGPVLGEGNQGAAAVWGLANICFLGETASVQRAGFATPDELFDALLTGRGVTFTVDDYDETWNRIVHDDGRVHLVQPELLEEFGSLAADGPPVDDAFPFVLSAGERRSSTANTILRDPTWMKSDHAGALRMSPVDAARLGVTDGDAVTVETKRSSARATVETTDAMQEGHVSLPNGRGLSYPGDDGGDEVHGVAPNELTDEMDRDWLAGTPHHKHVRARITALVGSE
ncbi:MAG: molybdopterin-dependent oxidoreductase [Acidimicrobiia bacterium]